MVCLSLDLSARAKSPDFDFFPDRVKFQSEMGKYFFYVYVYNSWSSVSKEALPAASTLEVLELRIRAIHGNQA